MNHDDTEKQFELIHRYTRAQGIEDGVLVDVSATAREAGFVMPVAVTAAVFAEYVAVPDGVSGQDVAGRLWDVLWMLRHGIRANTSEDSSAVRFELYVRNSDRQEPELVTLKALCGPGDDTEPVITIMLPHED